MDEDDVMFMISGEIDPIKSEVSNLASQTCDLESDLESANKQIKILQNEVNDLKQTVQHILKKPVLK